MWNDELVLELQVVAVSWGCGLLSLETMSPCVCVCVCVCVCLCVCVCVFVCVWVCVCVV